MIRTALVILLPGGCLVALLYLCLRKLADRQRDEAIDVLIVTPRVVFTDADEELARQTRLRRAHAESIKSEGRKLDTRDDPRSRIHVVRG